MSQPVVIKANNFGFLVVLDDALDFTELKEKVAQKFKESSKFLGDAQIVMSFEGRKLKDEEQKELLDIIAQNSDLKVVCVIDPDAEKEKLFKQTLEERLMELNSKTGQFYKGNLRSGQVVEFETSVIVLGDVNPGAKVISKGNVVILGALKGNVVAGATGNEHSFVVALEMNPVQIRIADTIARSPDKPVKETLKEPKIAFMEDGNIYIEPLNKSVLNDITLY